jgi:hypothetical protein
MLNIVKINLYFLSMILLKNYKNIKIVGFVKNKDNLKYYFKQFLSRFTKIKCCYLNFFYQKKIKIIHILNQNFIRFTNLLKLLY